MTLPGLVEQARGRNKHAIAKLVAVFEDTRASAPAQRLEVLSLLAESAPPRRTQTIIGLTGSPGAGKSSLVARVVPQLLAMDPKIGRAHV